MARGHPMSSEENVIDPVCGMTLTRLQAPFTRDLGGASYYLCSIECVGKFDRDGEAYAATARLKLPGWGETPHPESVTEQFRRPK
jgi:YHS domain-containing protein